MPRPALPLRSALLGALVAAVAATPAAAAPPWSVPVAVPGGATSGPAQVLPTTEAGSAVVFNAPGEGGRAPLLSSPLDGADAPGAPAELASAGDGLDAAFGSFASGAELLYAGRRAVGDRGSRAVVAIAGGPRERFAAAARGPVVSGVRAAVATDPLGGGDGAAVYGTIRRGPDGAVYLVRKPRGAGRFGASRRISSRGAVHAVAVAVNARGDVLAAWERSGRVEARFRYASGRLGPVLRLGRAARATTLSAAVGTGRRAVVAWVDQRVAEGEGSRARIVAVARTARRGFGAPTLLERYPDTTLVRGAGVRTAVAADGRGVVAWTGRVAVRAAFQRDRGFPDPLDLSGELTREEFDRGGALADLATATDGSVLALWLIPDAANGGLGVVAALRHAGDFAWGTNELVSVPGAQIPGASVRQDLASGRFVAAWPRPGAAGASWPVEVASRPAP